MKEHVIKGHGALGSIYPERYWADDKKYGFMEGGGTIPWIGLCNKGMFDINKPSWGGWGGRFTETKVADNWSRHSDIKLDEEKFTPFYTFKEVSDSWTDTETGIYYENEFVPVWRWRKAMLNDQICRMDWCCKPYNEANHHPVAVVNQNADNEIIEIYTKTGNLIHLDASASFDPDGDILSFNWWIYQEAGTYPGYFKIDNNKGSIASFTIPTGAINKQIHAILEICDNNPIASLSDYRRIVIHVASY